MRRLIQTAFIAIAVQAGIISAFADTPPQPSTRPTPITWDNAKKHVGETVTITGPVISTHPVNSGKWLTLNIGKDYPDPARFLILIKGQVNDSDYRNKKVTVTGKVVIYNNAPQIVAAPADVIIKTATVKK